METANPSPAVDLATLTRPFDRSAIKHRDAPGGGRKLAYIEGHTIIHRLNDATANRWSFVVDELSSVPAGATRNGKPQTLWICRGSLSIPTLGTRSNVGVQITTDAAEDLMKGAVTDCLKKCATMFGVALELYGDDYEGGERVDPSTGEILPPGPRPGSAPSAPAPASASSSWSDDDARPAEPCAIDGCKGVCQGNFVRYSTDKYGVPLCSKHSAIAKRGDLDVELDRLHAAKERRGAPASSAPASSAPATASAPVAGDADAWSAFWAEARRAGIANVEQATRTLGFAPATRGPVDALAALRSHFQGVRAGR